MLLRIAADSFRRESKCMNSCFNHVNQVVYKERWSHGLKLYRLKLRRNVEPLLYYVTCKLRNARKEFCKQVRYNNSRVFKHVTLFPALVS